MFNIEDQFLLFFSSFVGAYLFGDDVFQGNFKVHMRSMVTGRTLS